MTQKTIWLTIAAAFLLSFLLGGVFGCADDDDDNDNDDDDNDDQSPADDDNADDDNDTTIDDDDDTSPPAFSCEELGLPVREFVDAENSSALYATAADLTLPTTAGDWNFKENFTGCETYLFIQDLPRQCQGWPIDLWARDVAPFLMALPANVQVFYLSYEPDAPERQAELDALKAQVDEYVNSLPAEEAATWARRIHYVTEYAKDLPGWVGELMYSPKWGVGVDRFQRIRYIGSYADYNRFDSGMGWFAPNMKMAANEPVYYNFEAEREDRLAAENATVVHVFDTEDWASGTGYADVTLPDATTMATFDTLELDLYLGCVGDGEYGDCPAWDYIVNLYLCDEVDPDTCDVELGRWITTYHREGRWVHDISGILPLLAGGGQRRLAFFTSQPYEVKLDLRFSTQGKGVRPVSSTYLFSGGAFNPDYNTNYAPIEVAIPADAVQVQLATVITGHGGVEPGNCAEFCNTEHHFVVNDTDNLREFPEAGNSNGCMELVDEGTVPNQYGTWWYGRDGWCPGKEVQMVMIDVTSQVTTGADNTFEYYAFYQGEPYPSEGANIVLTSWVVVYK
ncbi:MAG: hypothetical protein GX444_11780 [Myxococcales bacterium]|nr:hypothetical protein [Myxococcales bacterium]